MTAKANPAAPAILCVFAPDALGVEVPAVVAPVVAAAPDGDAVVPATPPSAPNDGARFAEALEAKAA
jgi:hypothetical protein